MKPRQLVLDLPHRAARGREDFLVTPANAAAVAMIDGWRSWPSHAAVLVGPPGSGKTHLVEVWRQASGAGVVPVSALHEDAIPELMAGHALAVEDAPGDQLNERAMVGLSGTWVASIGCSSARRSMKNLSWPVGSTKLATVT